VPFHNGFISQFDGYERLAELDWARYRRTYDSVERLDLILEAEGDTPNRYRLSKQADVLMLLYLLGPTELVDTLARLSYSVTAEDLARTADYYLARTAHGSTLSRVVHTSVLTMLRREEAWSEYREALDADLDDVQGGTTGRGIHLGAMAGTVDIVLRSFTGMRLQADALVFRPRPPGALRRVGFEISYRGLRITVALDEDDLRLTGGPGVSGPVHVVLDGTSALLLPGQSLRFPLRDRGVPRGAERLGETPV
jgi:trehalose/maltose hydrolase-like predicted phosphorylase